MPEFKSTSVSRAAVGEERQQRELRRAKKEMRWVSLHHHSTYSFLDGYGHPADHVDRAWELGMTALALTEHGNVSSHVKLEKAAKARGIKPIFGCEMYCGPATPVQSKNHLTVLAEDLTGYRNLLSAVTWAWDQGFYYKPTIHGGPLAERKKGLIILSGCLGSLLATSLIGGKNIPPEEASFERGLEVAGRFKETFGDSYYLEAQAFPQLEDTIRVNQAVEAIGQRLRIPLVGTADVHYTVSEEAEMQRILHSVRPDMRQTVEDREQSFEEATDMSHPRSDAEVLSRLVAAGLSEGAAEEALANTGEIAERCTVSLPRAAPLRFPIPDKYRFNVVRLDKGLTQTQAYFRDLLREGWEYRGISYKADSQRYGERLEYEVNIIEQKTFVDYFLIVSDMVKWAKDHGIFVGPGRGSAAASLVCYLLRITEVDPMLFSDLVFERFIDITRVDIPDIDLDFDDNRRVEVFDYLRQKYGSEYVSQLGTFTTYKSRVSLDDVGRVYQIPREDVEAVKELLIERSSGDLRASATIEDTAIMFPVAKEVFDRHPDLMKATRLEGMVKGMGKHAAGAIVAATPIRETCAVYGPVTAVDKYDAEELNLLKMDILGLSTCGMLAEACGLLEKPITFLYDVPLDDAETIKGFQDQDLTGIFQFDGRAMRLVNNELQPESFYEVCVVNALARPGPLHNNATSYYVEIKHGKREPEASHPIFDKIVANTQWQVVYQEQILRIVREIGDFDWTHAAYIRKIISRKIGEQEFNRQWGRFWRGARKHGLDLELAKKIWGMCITSGSYAFNAAHSVSYGMLGFWTMWLKRHHPVVFFTSALRRLPEEKSLELMRDAVRHGVRILPPDPQRSKATWVIEEDGEPGHRAIRAGFEQIPGVGEKTANLMVDYRDNTSPPDLGLGDPPPFSWMDFTAIKGIGPKTIEKMVAWVSQEDPLGVHVLTKKLDAVVGAIRKGKLIGRDGARLPLPTHKAGEVPAMRGADVPVVWIGTISVRNLRDLFEVNMSRTGVPLDPSEVRDPDKREWVLLYGEDGDDVVTIKIDRWRYPRFQEMIWNIKLGRDIVLVRGVKPGWMTGKLIAASHIWVIE